MRRTDGPGGPPPPTAVPVWGVLPVELVAMFVLGLCVAFAALLVLVGVELVVAGFDRANTVLLYGMVGLLSVSGSALILSALALSLFDVLRGP